MTKRPKYLCTFFCFVWFSFLTLTVLLSARVPVLADDTPRPWRLTSWASPVGSQSLTYESLCGLKALLFFLNANQALGGREVELFSLESDDSRPEFLNRITNLMDQKKPDLAVGGAANAFPQLTADFFRRRGILWYGPWSNRKSLSNGVDPNPLLLFPTEDQELIALMTYTRKKLGRSEILFITLNDLDSRNLIQLARTTAEMTGLTLNPLALPPEFRDWLSLAGQIGQAKAIFLWLPPGQAAAIVRTFKPRLGPETLWLTSSLNSPGQELTNMTGGLWENMIFSSILVPKQSIATAYDTVIRKYGLPGLNLDYQTYLGFAQGQLLARVLNSRDLKDLKAVFPKTSAEGTLIYRPNLSNGNWEQNFYLAQSDRQGGWRALTN
ncbi:MAG: ABC transporter substrate-binding protein [Deltaproteobacteria bacterium]|jgi:ABC-type branched-subunit amino acid transport system substrate-binding protein|nr:ABC transporter substrate-binding protein [Deltaproteobacteria bacterium]